MDVSPLATSWRRHYDHVVSLGCGCQPANQIRRILGVTTAHVFDWMITTDWGLLALIESRLEGFFARERLHPSPTATGVFIDGPSDSRFIHEFPAGSNFDAKFAEHAGRMAELVRRWRELMDSDARVLFVRHHFSEPDPRHSAVTLRDTLASAAPRVRFSLLYLTREVADDGPWHEAGIVNRYLAQPVPYDWRGDDTVWERLLGEALCLDPR